MTTVSAYNNLDSELKYDNNPIPHTIIKIC